MSRYILFITRPTIQHTVPCVILLEDIMLFPTSTSCLPIVIVSLSISPLLNDFLAYYLLLIHKKKNNLCPIFFVIFVFSYIIIKYLNNTFHVSCAFVIPVIHWGYVFISSYLCRNPIISFLIDGRLVSTESVSI
jgi:hypothetical protein